ncbi:24-hydroxycholesterol 7-alpha-hydroxylase isoform X1 [Huso huso]|uniref:24-hydroxycholesterol 7-alpha-hydroxylase isoform X1 n=1 Tax=Huso huso TaxID=61971 RepID=A0ABR0ZUM6_HUSHU
MGIEILLLLVLSAFSVYFLFVQRKHPNYPPCIRGWIPWFGAAFQFGKAPLDFLAQARAKYGPVFTIAAAGKRLTFVNLHEDFNTFFMSKDVDFQQAVQDPVQRTASISKESFFKNHPACHALIKGRLTRSNLHEVSSDLCAEFNEHLELLTDEGAGDLSDLVRHVMYPAVMSNLLGKCNSPASKAAVQEFTEQFQTYDEGFEYGSQLPELFLRKWAKAKQWLLSLMKSMVLKAKRNTSPDTNSKTLLQHFLTILTDSFSPNYALLMMWASLANAIPITFWTLGFIISQPSVYRTVMEEIASSFGEKDKTKSVLSESELQQLPYIQWCVLEAIRLRSPGTITRKVVRPIKIQNYIIPPGDMLMLSPFWAHRDPRYFPEPEKFMPERWKKANLEKNVFLEGFVAFGGGRYQCPGRWYALMEIQMFIGLILYKYELTLLDSLPKPSSRHLVGTQQPDGPCRVQYNHR